MRVDHHGFVDVAVALLVSTFLVLFAFAAPAGAKDRITVFAAASMKNALDHANEAFGRDVSVSYAASSTLAKQIEAGAPADIFISADLDWMAYLSQRKLVKEETRTDWLSNRIVLVAAKGLAKPVEIGPDLDLASLLAGGRLAIGEPISVPAGKYAKAALEKLGLWSGVENNVASAESVRAALALVSRGEAPYGIVYQTDAAADPNVAVVATFPAESHPPIIYPIAILSESNSPDAATYLDYLTSEKAAPFFEREGFTMVKKRD
jgi:molybdate transport system substrate-binding protein